MAQAAKRGGHVEDMLPGAIECPAGLEYLWQWFLDLHAARQMGGMGPSALAYSEILAWATLMHRFPRPWEVDVLRDLDAVWIEEWMKSKPSGKPVGGKGKGKKA